MDPWYYRFWPSTACSQYWVGNAAILALAASACLEDYLLGNDPQRKAIPIIIGSLSLASYNLYCYYNSQEPSEAPDSDEESLQTRNY